MPVLHTTFAEGPDSTWSGIQNSFLTKLTEGTLKEYGQVSAKSTVRPSLSATEPRYIWNARCMIQGTCQHKK